VLPLLNPTSQLILNSINSTQQDMNRAQSAVSSGLRITQASDDPQEINDLLQTRSDIAQATQTTTNLTGVQTEVQTADSVVQQAITALDSARSLAAQGADTSLSAQDRANLATQVQGIIAQIVSISRTQVNGSYIFSGDQTNSPPYQTDPNSPNGVQQLVNSPSTRLIQDGTGLTFAASLTAQQLFDVRDTSGNPTTGNVFTALGNLVSALQANDTTAIESAATDVTNADQYLNQQGAFYGEVENRVSTALDLAQKFQTQETTNLSNEQDADVAAEALQITQDTTHLDASMAAAAKLPSNSLFNYLPTS